MVIAGRRFKFRTKAFRHLTDSQWQVIKELVEDGRQRKYKLRDIVNAILKVVRTGVQWRNLDSCYPPWESVYYYFTKWQKNNTWSLILRHLVRLERVRQGRHPDASMCAVDSQSIKTGGFISICTGLDGNKKINGRKRHFAVDILGLPLGIHISAANQPDGKQGVELLWQIEETSPRIKTICADKAYKGYFKECVELYGWEIDISQRPPSQKGFVPQKARWQVERSFGWLNPDSYRDFRRLACDFEKTIESSAAFCQLAFISIILARLEN